MFSYWFLNLYFKIWRKFQIVTPIASLSLQFTSYFSHSEVVFIYRSHISYLACVSASRSYIKFNSRSFTKLCWRIMRPFSKVQIQITLKTAADNKEFFLFWLHNFWEGRFPFCFGSSYKKIKFLKNVVISWEIEQKVICLLNFSYDKNFDS